jgi:hypothetical protein
VIVISSVRVGIGGALCAYVCSVGALGKFIRELSLLGKREIMQAPDIHSGDPVEKDNNEQRVRKARLTIEVEWFGRASDIVPLKEYMDRSIQLRMHDETLRFEAAEIIAEADGYIKVSRAVAEQPPRNIDGQCRLCGAPEGVEHMTFCRFNSKGMIG